MSEVVDMLSKFHMMSWLDVEMKCRTAPEKSFRMVYLALISHSSADVNLFDFCLNLQVTCSVWLK